MQPAAPIAAVVGDPRRPSRVVDDEPAQHVAVRQLETPVVPVPPEVSPAATHRREGSATGRTGVGERAGLTISVQTTSCRRAARGGGPASDRGRRAGRGVPPPPVRHDGCAKCSPCPIHFIKVDDRRPITPRYRRCCATRPHCPPTFYISGSVAVSVDVVCPIGDALLRSPRVGDLEHRGPRAASLQRRTQPAAELAAYAASCNARSDITLVNARTSRWTRSCSTGCPSEPWRTAPQPTCRSVRSAMSADVSF